MPHPLIAFLQGETTGLSEEAGQVAESTGRETVSVLGEIGGFFQDAFAYVTSPEFIANVVATVVAAALGLFIYKLLGAGIPRLLRWRERRGEERLDAEALSRIKRQDTAIALARNALGYVIFIIVAFFAVSLFFRDVLPALAGATVLAAVVGFGAQSFLRDIIAGFSIVFEGQYSVGDFVTLEPTRASGIVEEFGLRTTKIRALSGEVIFIPNGTLTGVTNYVSGQQRYTLEILLRDDEAAERVVRELGKAPELYVTAPRLAAREKAGDNVRLRILAGTLPSMNWLVEENLVARIKAAAGEELASEPLIYTVDRASLKRIRSLIPEEEKS